MKKRFVALLIGLALIVMISPGIVGRLAEQSMDENLDWVASMSRERGSLLPGLGSAISTLSIETAGGEVFALPGTIYSTVGLAGDLRSNYVLDAGSYKQGDATIYWGPTETLVTTNPSSGAVGFDGSIESLAVDSMQETIEIKDLQFSGTQSPTPFGFRAGPLSFSFESIDYGSIMPGEIIGPLTFTSTSSVDGDRLDAHMALLLKNVPFADMGAAGIAAEFRIEDADGHAIGGIKRAMESMQDGEYSGALQASVESDARRLLAAGVSLHIDQLDISLPQGLLTMQFKFEHPATDLGLFSWTSALLVMDASANVSVPVELMDLITTMNPQAHATIAMGFLRRKGNAYEMEASFKKGLLSVNGAPMPLPIPGLQ